MLSEFGWHGFGRYLASRPWGTHLALLIVFFALVQIGLGHLAGCNALDLIISATSTVPNLRFTQTSVHVYGYLDELNHGFFYVLVAPLMATAADRLTRKMALAVSRLQRRKLLIPAPDARQWLARTNRVCFWAIAVPASVAVFSLNVVAEWTTCRPGELGFVQGPFLPSWVESFNRSTPAGQWKMIASEKSSTILGNKTAAFLGAIPLIPTAWQPFVHLPKLAGSGTENFGSLTDPTSRGPVLVDLQKASQAGLVTLSASTDVPTAHLQRTLWWRLFCVMYVIYEGLFHAFAVWLVVKTICIVLFIGRSIDCWRPLRLAVRKVLRGVSAHAGRNPSPVRLIPILRDRTKRFGLDDLHPVYNEIALLLLLSGFCVALSYQSNAYDQTAFWAGAANNLFTGQLLIMAGVIIGAGFLAGGPAMLFARRFNQMKKRDIEAVDEQIVAAGTDADKYSTLCEVKELLSQQTAWPRDDVRFKKMAIFMVIFLLLPWLANWHLLPDSVAPATNIIEFIRAAMTSLSHAIYGIPAAPG